MSVCALVRLHSAARRFSVQVRSAAILVPRADLASARHRQLHARLLLRLDDDREPQHGEEDGAQHVEQHARHAQPVRHAPVLARSRQVAVVGRRRGEGCKTNTSESGMRSREVSD